MSTLSSLFREIKKICRNYKRALLIENVIKYDY